jgi:hypothetical protein
MGTYYSVFQNIINYISDQTISQQRAKELDQIKQLRTYLIDHVKFYAKYQQQFAMRQMKLKKPESDIKTLFKISYSGHAVHNVTITMDNIDHVVSSMIKLHVFQLTLHTGCVIVLPKCTIQQFVEFNC